MAPEAAANSGPPSTLAAELVGNISTAARSSRPDENSELKRLFETIEAVKNDPESLKTANERVEHNHLLIYVYACVVLDGLKWDDPFANRDSLRLEASKAMHFLKVTIQETPSVLKITTNGSAFLHRGREPLWAWLFPKILKMLGHPYCLPLAPTVDSFFQFILVDASKSSGLWNISEPMFAYLQANYRCKTRLPLILVARLTAVIAVLVHLKSASLDRRGLDLELPRPNLLPTLLPELAGADGIQGGFYSFVDKDHAIRHAACLLKLLCTAALPDKQPRRQIVSFNKHLPWLIDSLEALNDEQKRWRNHCDYAPYVLLDLALEIARSSSSLHPVVSHKLDSIMALLAADVAAPPDDPHDGGKSDGAADRTLAFALVHLADVSITKRPVAKLVTAQLLKPLDRFRTEGQPKDNDLLVCLPRTRTGSPQTDCFALQRSVTMLQNIVAAGPFSPEVLPESFDDRRLRSRVQAIKAKSVPAQDDKRAVKRRKISPESTTMLPIMRRLCKVLGRPATETLENMEDTIL